MGAWVRESYDYAASESTELPQLRFCAFCRSVSEKLLAFFAQKTANHGDRVIAFFKNEAAGDQARSPFIDFVAVLAPVGVNVLLRNSEDDRPDFGPHASTGTHGAGFVRRVQNKVRQVAAITAAHVFEHFELDVFDAGSRSFYPVSGAGDDRLALSGHARNNRPNGIVAPVAGALGFRNGQFHELLLRLIRSRNHAIRLYEIIVSVPQAYPRWAGECPGGTRSKRGDRVRAA